jgi:hypothetical protein
LGVFLNQAELMMHAAATRLSPLGPRINPKGEFSPMVLRDPENQFFFNFNLAAEGGHLSCKVMEF